MSSSEYQKFKKQLKQTQQKTEKMLLRIANTLTGVQQTLQQIQQNHDNIEKFQKSFGDVMKQLAEKIVGSMSNPFKRIQNKEYEYLPCELPISDVIKRMLAYEDILIITGAGVSAPSGIPTFRGQNGLYDKKFMFEGIQYEPEQFISKEFFTRNPKPIWDWVEQIYHYTEVCKPNKVHYLINDLAILLSKLKKKVTLVTQNIDDLHLKPQKQDGYLYYNIHGNVKELRCDNLHFFKYWVYRSQILAGKQVKCPTCQSLLRPHVLFFDESYGPFYGSQVKDKKYGLVLVVGSSLSTGLCTKLTLNAQEIVQINPSPVIQVGRVYQYKKQAQQVLEEIKINLQKTLLQQ